MDDNLPKPGRWFLFSLRTMFVLVTVFCVWLGYQLNWIRQRHKVIEGGQAIAEEDSMLEEKHAPAPLWLFGEKGRQFVSFNVSDAEHPTSDELRKGERLAKLFPEAMVSASDAFEGHPLLRFPQMDTRR